MEEFIYRHRRYGVLKTIKTNGKNYIRCKDIQDCSQYKNISGELSSLSTRILDNNYVESNLIDQYFSYINTRCSESVKSWIKNDIIGNRVFTATSPVGYRLKWSQPNQIQINLNDLKTIIPSLKDDRQDEYIPLSTAPIDTNETSLGRCKWVCNAISRRYSSVSPIPMDNKFKRYGLLLSDYSWINNFEWLEYSIMDIIQIYKLDKEDFFTLKDNYFYTLDFMPALTPEGIDVLNQRLNIKIDNRLFINAITKGDIKIC